MKKILGIFSLLLLTGSLVMGQTVQITGNVKGSEDGLAMPGVFVQVKGTTIGTITGLDGNYTIAVPSSAQSLVFSFVGFVTHEETIQGRTRIDVILKQDLYNVDEVVVVAYGTQQRRDIAGAITTVKGDAIQSIPMQSFDQALQGRAAGVSITMPNGVLNNPPVIRIRGINSMTASSYPLIVVDGVPIATGNWSGNSAITNALADINPADIQSMEILKDASATALFGSRAANGVIIITTKRGSGARTRVTYDGYVGMTEPYRLFEMMNATQYIEHKNKAWQNLSGPTAPQLSLVNDASGQPINTRWSDYVYRTGLQHNHSITFSGSTASTNYFLSVGYTDQEGMIKKNTYNRKSLRLNLDHKLNKYISLGANASYTKGFNQAPNTGASFATAGAARLAFVLPPNIGPFRNDGSYNIEGSALGRMGQPFPALGYYNVAAIFELNKFTAETDRLLATISASVEPLKGLVLKTVFGMDNLSIESITYQSPVTGDSFGSNGYAGSSMQKNSRWTWTNTINYNTTLFERFNIGLLGGIEEQYNVNNWWSGSKTNVSDPFFTSYQGSWVTAGMGGGGQGENYYISYFGRINFNYDRKYFVEFSTRRDGFSGLSVGNKFGTFGGASVMWRASNESFIANTGIGEIFSDIRLKGSYGRVGNMAGIGDFSSLFLYGSGVYGAIPTLTFSQAGNANLKWEASDKYDIGLSFGILNDKIQLDLNWFYNDINDLILNVPQAPSKGIPNNSIPANVGSMYNTGFEFTVTSYNISKSRFSWTTTFNLSTLKNEVTELAPGLTELIGITGGLETTSRTKVGYPIGNIYAVETRGVDPTSGRRIYVDRNGKEVLYRHEFPAAERWLFKDGSGYSTGISIADGKIMGSPLPKVYGGIDNVINYRDFDFSVNLTYSLGFDLYNGSKAGLRDQRWWNNSVEVYETAWKKEGDITNIPKPVMNDNISNGSAFVISENIERGDYMKVRSISLGYSLKNLPGDLSIERIRLYGQVFNALVFTKYSGSDPEVSTEGGSNLAPGIDRNTAPQARTYTLGLNVTF